MLQVRLGSLQSEWILIRHVSGKTDQAKSDMARLQEIRKKREADAKARIAREEGEFKDPFMLSRVLTAIQRRSEKPRKSDRLDSVAKSKTRGFCQVYIRAIV